MYSPQDLDNLPFHSQKILKMDKIKKIETLFRIWTERQISHNLRLSGQFVYYFCGCLPKSTFSTQAKLKLSPHRFVCVYQYPWLFYLCLQLTGGTNTLMTETDGLSLVGPVNLR